MSERPLRALLVIAVVLIAVPWSFKLANQGQLGESCEGGFDCALGSGRCVMGEQGRFCTSVCTADEQCPGNAHCGVPPHDYDRVWYSASVLSETVCVPGPRPAHPPSIADFQPQAPDLEPARSSSTKSR